QALLPTADGNGRVAALEILIPDDAVRNLIRQAKVEQVYSFMQTGTKRGMQTMEQSLADLTLRRVIDPEEGFARTSRPDQYAGILQRAGMNVTFNVDPVAAPQAQPVLSGGLRPPGQ
ncbi:MAG: twitching motility protein PilT, partial [Gaiellaceae bacterium]|nr:twitching motility protein PilT [Gaiellaceae bacterium]